MSSPDTYHKDEMEVVTLVEVMSCAGLVPAQMMTRMVCKWLAGAVKMSRHPFLCGIADRSIRLILSLVVSVARADVR
jgi:hypothetical protein